MNKNALLSFLLKSNATSFESISTKVLQKAIRQVQDDFLISNIEVVNNRILIIGRKDYTKFDKGTVEMVYVFHSNGDYAFCPDAEYFNQKRNVFLGI
jgi:hypothetical protein